jgi:hypothetical protein
MSNENFPFSREPNGLYEPSRIKEKIYEFEKEKTYCFDLRIYVEFKKFEIKKYLKESEIKNIEEMQLEYDELLDVLEGIPIGMFLSHEYSKETLSVENLKGRDAVYFNEFRRNSKYNISLVPVKILVEGEEEYLEDAEVSIQIESELNAYFLNDYNKLKLKVMDYEVEETGNSETSVSFHYNHSAILIYKSEINVQNPKRIKIDMDEQKEKVRKLFQYDGFEETNLLKCNLDLSDLQNELTSIMRRSFNNVHVMIFILKNITKTDVLGDFKRFISFVSFLLLGFLFKSKEELDSEEIQQLKECESISSKYTNIKESRKESSSKDVVYHFHDCLTLLETNFESKNILEIMEGNLQINANESCELLKIRIVELFKMNKFREKKNVSKYLTLETLKKSQQEIVESSKFLTPYSTEYAFILYLKFMMMNESNSSFSFSELLDLVLLLNKNREEQRETLFNVCIENLSEFLFQNYANHWNKACERLIHLADEQIASVSFNLLLKLLERNPKTKGSPEISLNRILEIHESGQFYISFRLFRLNLEYIQKDEKMMNAFYESARSQEEILSLPKISK